MNFEEWVDVEGLSPEERARLERVHELLLEAGPPASLPSGLERPPAPVIPLRRLSRRRAGVAALLAAAILVAAAFVGGYFAGQGGGMHVAQQASLQSAGGGRAFASLEIGRPSESGNYPIEMAVRGLPPQANERAYYLLLLWRHGRPAGVCGAFRVSGGVTKLRFDVPYEITSSTRWVVTAVRPGVRYPGTVLMKTVNAAATQA
jgi:hypothetical protein